MVQILSNTLPNDLRHHTGRHQNISSKENLIKRNRFFTAHIALGKLWRGCMEILFYSPTLPTYMKTFTKYENSPTLEDFNGEKLHTKLHPYKSGFASRQNYLMQWI